MSNNQFSLLKTKRFFPLFITQFLGAFHDNLFKSAMVAILLFSTTGGLVNADEETTILVTLATAVFILPFVLFSALAGQYTDKYDKKQVIQAVKLAEIGIAILGSTALLLNSTPLSFLTLFALGTQSAFFGPSKFSILPQHLEDKELVGGNALLSVGTFLAILIGTIAGMALINVNYGIAILSILLISSAILGYASSYTIPSAPSSDTKLKINFNIASETYRILRTLFTSKHVMIQCALGIGWFWFIGSVFLGQMPNFTRLNLGANEHVSALFMVLFSIGIGLGGLLNNRLLNGRIEALYVPLAAIGVTIFAIDLYFATMAFPLDPNAATLMSIHEFTDLLAGWRIIVDLFLIAMFAGLFVIPLNAIFQHNCEDKSRARLLAALSVMNAGFIVLASLLSSALFKIGFSIPQLFMTMAIGNLIVAIYICQLLPAYLFKTILQLLFKLLYKVEIRGLENFEKAGDRAIIVGNHVSLLDPPLLAAFLPGKPMFAVNSFVAEWFWVKPFLKLVDAFPLNPTNPFSIKSLIKEVEKNKHCVIFPEGRLTETGALMKVYEGPGLVADKSDAMILPVRLDGVQHTPFARLKGKIPLKSFPKITITILPPRKLEIDPEIKGRARRAAAGRELYTIMEEMMFVTTDREQTLFEALLKARHINGDNSVIVEDAEFKPLKFKKLLQGSLVLGRKITNISKKSENIGVLLPNSVGTAVTFFGLQAYGRIPAMLNFSAGAKALTSACKTAKIKTVLSSRRFIEMGRMEGLIEELSTHANIVYLEDIKKTIGVSDKIFALMASPTRIHAKQKIAPNDPALILFTSGSEGMPKGVVLSHENIMSNIVQLSSRVDFNRQDIVFNCLPMFHSFGLTGGTLLPILSGVKTFLYPSPLHYRIVPELVYSTNATIMFGTDTFLRGYARMAHPYDFYRMRYIFAGAEKVKDETRDIYMNKYGVRILEGYGATETAPVLAVNAPMHFKPGTVGRMLPGIETKLEDVPGVEDGGRLFVKGPNIMLGYYRDENPGVLEPPTEGWYDTGDIVNINEDGYVQILGRAKRFAKIAGEMVSLTSVEAMIQKIYPDENHAVIAIPDARKGEQLIFVTTQNGADKKELSLHASQNGISELAVPKTIINVDKLPVLGSGKTDYTTLQADIETQLIKG